MEKSYHRGKDIQIRKSKSGKSVYVMKVNNKRYRVNSLKEGAAIAGVHFSRLWHIMDKGITRKQYNVKYRDQEFIANSFEEIADKLGFKKSQVASVFNKTCNFKSRGTSKLRYLFIERI